MREKTNRDKRAPDKSAPDNEERQSGFKPSLAIRGEPAPIDVAAFGKRLGDIITKAVRASRKRHNPEDRFKFVRRNKQPT